MIVRKSPSQRRLWIDGEHAVPAQSQLDKRACVLGVGGEGLLDNDVQAGFERGSRDGRVHPVGGGDDRQVVVGGASPEFVDGVEHLDTRNLLLSRRSALRVTGDDRCDGEIRGSSDERRVKETSRQSVADQGNAKRRRHFPEAIASCGRDGLAPGRTARSVRAG